MKKLQTILLIILATLVALWGVTLYRQNTHGTWSAYMNSYENDCNVQLPQNFKIVYNENEKRYAVQIIDKILGKQFLWGRNGDWIDESFDVYTDFSDSCIAKSFAVQYLKEQREHYQKQNGYK